MILSRFPSLGKSLLPHDFGTWMTGFGWVYLRSPGKLPALYLTWCHLVLHLVCWLWHFWGRWKGETTPVVKVRVFSLTRETKASFLDFVFCFLASLTLCFGRAELEGDGVFLCRQKSAVGQHSFGTHGNPAGILASTVRLEWWSSSLFQHAVRVSLTFT